MLQDVQKKKKNESMSQTDFVFKAYLTYKPVKQVLVISRVGWKKSINYLCINNQPLVRLISQVFFFFIDFFFFLMKCLLS